MRKAFILSSLCATAWCTVSPAQAMGFGSTATPSALGQPLDFHAAVRVAADEEITRECVVAEVFAGEGRLGSDQVRVVLRPGATGGERSIHVSTQRPINEPVVTVNLRVGCVSPVARQFVTFLDPPLLRLARANDAPAPTEPQVNPVPSTRSVPALALGGTDASVPATPARNRARATERRRAVSVAASTFTATPHAATAAQSASALERRKVAGLPAAVAARPNGGPRLQLEASTAPAPTELPNPSPNKTQVAGAGPTNDGAAAAVSSDSAELDKLNVELAQEREKVRVLEATLVKLRAEIEASNRKAAAAATAVATVPASVRAPQGQEARNYTPAGPLLYPLVGLGVLLTTAMGFALWRPKKGSFGSSRWWVLSQHPQEAAEAKAIPSGFESIRDRLDDVRAPSSLLSDSQLPELVESIPAPVPVTAAAPVPPRIATPAPVSIGGLEVTTVSAPKPFAASVATAPAPLAAANGDSADEFRMESLIDLEQEAEFFIVIGQDEAAVNLLAKHVNREGSVSPLPFLKLLQIHRRRDDEAAFAAVGEAFERRFGIAAPAWPGARTEGRPLEDYPRAMSELQSAWVSPRRVMETLDAWLFRRQATEAFDLAACRDLLFLYAVARDRSDAGGDPAIDVELPFDATQPIDVTLPYVSTKPFDTTTAPVAPGTPLDFDISVSGALDFDISVVGPLDAESELRQPV